VSWPTNATSKATHYSNLKLRQFAELLSKLVGRPTHRKKQWYQPTTWTLFFFAGGEPIEQAIMDKFEAGGAPDVASVNLFLKDGKQAMRPLKSFEFPAVPKTNASGA